MIFLAVASVLVSALVYAGVRSVAAPSNRPERFRRDPSDARPVVVCAGDSITHGAVSFDYVRALEARLGDRFRFVNGGINGDLAWNLRERLSAIVACDPDVVTILIGTNDVMGSTIPRMGRGQVVAKGLPERATFEGYEANLRAIVSRLRSETRARVVLVTLPPLGDAPDTPIAASVRRGSDILRRVAHDEDLTLVDLGDAIDAARRSAGHTPNGGLEGTLGEFVLMVRAPILRYLAGRSYDAIADGAGLFATTDRVHLNERSGTLLVERLASVLVLSSPDVSSPTDRTPSHHA